MHINISTDPTASNSNTICKPYGYSAVNEKWVPVYLICTSYRIEGLKH